MVMTMNFDKLINDMQELQSKVALYEQRNKIIDEAINSINKDIVKLEKKKDNSKDEIDKHILAIKELLMKEIVTRFNVDNTK